jgi:large subunit ribosomal protein L10
MLQEAKKVGVLTREKIVAEINERIASTQACLFISFNKLNAFAFNSLRNSLRAAGASVFIARNSLFRRALSDLGWKDFESFFEAETGIVLTTESDIVAVCKILVEFTQEHEALQLKGGVVQDKPITDKEIRALAKLPSREVLLGMVVSGVAAPLTGFLVSLNQVILKFVWLAEELKKVKEQQK